MSPCEVVVGADGGAELRIRVVGRMHLGATNFWDGNRPVSPIELVVGGFTGRGDAGLRSEELLRLRERLELLYESLEGEGDARVNGGLAAPQMPR